MDTTAEPVYSDPEDCEIDLVIGWVAPVGTEIDPYVTHVTKKLEEPEYGFTVFPIKVIELIEGKVPIKNYPDFKSKDYFKKTRARQSAGDEIREKTGEGGALAGFVVDAIRQYRLNNPGVKRRAFIVKSLKHPEEAIHLRRTYGHAFFLIGAHGGYASRHSFLKRKCKNKSDKAVELIEIDEDEGVKHGQRTRDLFELCDAFITHTTAQRNANGKKELDRIFDLLFGAINIPPRVEEYGMVSAFRSAEQSGDLARQVGAALFSSTGDLVATGRNDAPKAGGGVYRFGETPDVSDMALGYDPGQKCRDDLIDNVIDSIVDSDFGKKQKLSMYRTQLTSLVKASKLKDIVEYGRSVHAEMDTLMNCARNGVKTEKCQLFVTTFPCHNCARHIIGSGIMRCVYLEPYRKSRALELHADSIKCDALPPDGMSLVTGESPTYIEDAKKVVFEPFVGISPRRFSDFFSLRTAQGSEIKRKDESGNLQDFLKPPKFEQCGNLAPGSFASKLLRYPPSNDGLASREQKTYLFLLKDF